MSHLPKLPEVIQLIRPDDLLNLHVVTENLRLEHDPSPDEPPDTANSAENAPVSLVVDNPNLPALLRVIFPPQHIAEFAVFESDPKIKNDTSGSDASTKKAHENREKAQAKNLDADENKDADKPKHIFDPNRLPLPGMEPFKARIAAASRLVFRVPAGRRIPYTVEGLLDWRELEPVLHPIAALGEDASAAQRAAAPPIGAPTADQTALELPYRLLISPNSTAIWTHRTQPFGTRGRYELWHTRLVVPNGQNFNELDPEHPAPLRALWSPDYRPDQKPEDRER
ncbi:MAG: hypothetical protein IDH49_14450 [Gammaproteobacteria bacterium]|nr:hypothetical protein [Gammaproteobacteria bacterium]